MQLHQHLHALQLLLHVHSSFQLALHLGYLQVLEVVLALLQAVVCDAIM
jgi:hypothetical protein